MIDASKLHIGMTVVARDYLGDVVGMVGYRRRAYGGSGVIYIYQNKHYGATPAHHEARPPKFYGFKYSRGYALEDIAIIPKNQQIRRA